MKFILLGNHGQFAFSRIAMQPSNSYQRFGGTFFFLRPDGSSYFIQP